MLKSLLVCLLISLACCVAIQKGTLSLAVTSGNLDDDYRIPYNGLVSETISLTQLSKIDISAQITFSQSDFEPEFFSFRLRHPHHDNLSEPVLATLQGDTYKAQVDLGDPKHVRHMNGDYQLEMIISDDRLDNQIRHVLAHCKVSFRYSLEQPIPNQLLYIVPSTIMTQAPATREDPPALFTSFVLILLIGIFAGWLWGLWCQGANLKLFPSRGAGFLLNIGWLVCLGVVFWVLLEFWVEWTFLQTLRWVLLGILPISLAANYAFVHIQKQ